MDIFNNFIKIGVNFPKSNVKLPKNWQNLKESKYNNEENFAILTGQINDIVVIDLDNKDSTFKGKLWFENNFGEISKLNTLVTKTVNNGYHIYYKYTSKLKNTLNYKGLHIDILSDKKCVYEGKGYDLLNNNKITELNDNQVELLKQFKKKFKKICNKNNKNLNSINLNKLNNIFELPQDTKWTHNRTDNGYICNHTCDQCLIDVKYTHTTNNHSTLFINDNKSIIKTCFSHGSEVISKDLSDQIFNILFQNEDINNKDTLQVAKKILEYRKIIYKDKLWYMYNEINGIYDHKNDIQIIKEIGILVESLNKTEYQNWFEWIKKINYKKNLLEELKSECYFEDKIDNNIYLLGFQNGVLELKTKNLRKGLREEYITMKCNIEYNENIDKTLANNILSSMFLNTIERQYVINKLSMSLDGDNMEQKLTFNYGYTASNGKSFLMERMRDILGDYGGSFPVTVLTGKMKNSGEANSSLTDFLNKRFMYCSEPETNSKLNTNMVKQLTGDIIKTRGLYQDQDVEIKPTFKIFVCCNSLPNFDSYDEGIARRISILEFRTKFCNQPKKKNEMLIIKYTSDEINQINKGLISILVENYYILFNNSYKYQEPESFKSIRKLYLNDNKDIIRETLKESLEKGSYKDFVKLKDIKKILKYNNIKDKDILTIIRIILDEYDDVEFFEQKKMDNIKLYSIFTNIKIKIVNF